MDDRNNAKKKSKKKLSPRELREQQQAEKRARYQKRDADKKAAEEARLEQERQNARNKLAEKIAASSNKEVGTVRKSAAKAANLKSTFILDDRTLLMTSFGRGSAAQPEKRITNGQVTSINQPPAFQAEARSHQYAISGRMSAVSDDPLHNGQGIHVAARRQKDAEQGVGQSVGFLREKLEQKFYGQTFSDNIHIQLIYSILDIEKLLASHINHITYEINNLFRDKDSENPDFMGYMSLNVPYEEICFGDTVKGKAAENNKRSLNSLNLLTGHMNQRYYFNSAFNDWLYVPEGVSKKDKAAREYWSRWNVYYRLCLLGMTRQAMSHENTGKEKNIYQLDAKFDPAFQSDPLRKAAREEARQMLDTLFGSRVRELNEHFLEMAKRNLIILFRVYGITGKAEKAELVRNYYRFTVRKEFKNLGLSIKTLREYLLDCIKEQEHQDIRDDCYNSVRHKMYQMFDFVLFDYFRSHPDAQDSLVSELRSAMNDAEKEAAYIRAAVGLWPEIRDVFMEGVLPQMDGDRIGKIRTEDPDVSAEMLTEQIGEGAHTFSKLIYLLTLYLDGKEINDLLTGLINKLENIQAFQSVLEWENLPVKLADEYSIFEESGQIAAELRIINSFARMEKKNEANAKKVMFIEAAQVLGDYRSEKELSDYFDALLDKDRRPLLKNGKRDNQFRNFICNNVIDTPRFRYLVRYADPRTVREIIRNHAVVMLVLNDIPDTQITRYYNTCTGKNQPFSPEMRGELAEKLANLSFLEFEGVKGGKGLSPQEIQENERQKSIIRLYLTVLYLVVKNLVYINARYTLAFHCLERDFALEYGMPIKDNQFIAKANDLTRNAIGQKRLNCHAARCMEQNLANSDGNLIRQYRNKIAHLNAVRDAAKYIGDLREAHSYFEVYHYLIQRSLQEGYRSNPGQYNPKAQEYFAALDRYHTYCKDFVKALNTPFGYNLPRYKNLSIDGLFDRNRPGKGETAEKCIEN